MLNDDFYANLPYVENLVDLTEPDNFVAVPDNWYVIITDITNSTQAIAAGKYKEVNLIGASSIAAILNIAGNIEIPFVFGGDGAELLIPSSLLAKTKEVLVAVQRVARSQFNLYLRVGILPVSAVIAAGFEVKIAKLRVSENYSQVLITGGGIAYATEFIKEYSIPDIYQLRRQSKLLKADFSGLECRWQDIPSRHEEVLTLQVLAIAHNQEKNHQIYRNVLNKIQHIYGSSQDFHPIVPGSLNLTFRSKNLMAETKLRADSEKRLAKPIYLLQIKLGNVLGWLFMSFKLVLDGVNWGLYKKTVVNATDYQKFDDMLRLVISGSVSQRATLLHYLNEEYTRGSLVYGFHISDRLLMTCLVFERNGRQVHFIDGAGGGFAEAAKALKERMLRKSLNWRTFLKLIRLRKSAIPYNL
ncbi:DUF3095 domain-containing protein [Oscillatoria sp. FACHB-1407]|uniref:DUF3095 domain-containing protein n=1 Tax=Oscillatoria sp. FACHB-1407 TaxID=2692847 RepID=UPI001687D0AE|nr:DUF3095 domain-containing protein [Oscillatoria sp. FACHB-1407]MBD2464326.1 DUF3095 domain-containing protein [Oscillatoria sp. FACHB-1407]